MSTGTLDTERIALLAKALAHPSRVQIVELLARQSECRGADVFSELPLAQSTVSEHLRVLKDAGIVSATHAGTASVFCLRADALTEFASDLTALAATARECKSGECGR